MRKYDAYLGRYVYDDEYEDRHIDSQYKGHREGMHYVGNGCYENNILTGSGEYYDSSDGKFHREM